MRTLYSICLLALAAGCGSVTNSADASTNQTADAASNAADASTNTTDAPVSDAPVPDAALPDACVPSLTVTSNFVATTTAGDGNSNLDPILNKMNSFTLTLSGWTFHKEAVFDPVGGGGVTFKTGVQSSNWTVDFSGNNGALLDSDLGQWLSRGLAIGDSLFELGDDGHYYLYLLPDDTSAHPYMAVNCYGAPVIIGADSYPVIEDVSLFDCDIIFYDFRSPVAKNLIGNATASFDVSVHNCGM